MFYICDLVTIGILFQKRRDENQKKKKHAFEKMRIYFVVSKNTDEIHDVLLLFFTSPPLCCGMTSSACASHKAHGRLFKGFLLFTIRDTWKRAVCLPKIWGVVERARVPEWCSRPISLRWGVFLYMRRMYKMVACSYVCQCKLNFWVLLLCLFTIMIV